MNDDGVLVVGGTLVLVFFVLMLAFVYFAYLGWGAITHWLNNTQNLQLSEGALFWIPVIVTIIFFFIGIHPFFGIINIAVGIYGLVLFFT